MILFFIANAANSVYAIAYLLHAAKRRRSAAACGAALLSLLSLAGGLLCLLA